MLNPHALTRHLSPLLFLLLASFLFGCSQETDTPSSVERASKPQHEGPPLRVLTLSQLNGEDFLPRRGLPESAERELVRGYAEQAGRAVEWVGVDSVEAIFASLEQGKGDMAAANLTITPARLQRVSFSAPVTFVREVIVGRKGDALASVRELAGRTVVVNQGSSFEETLERTRKERFQEPFRIEAVAGTDLEALLDRVAEGEGELTVLDSNSAEALLPAWPDLEIVLALPNVQPIGWAVPQGRHDFVTSLSRYLSEHQLLGARDEDHREDLAGIKKRGVLRVATRNNAANYFLLRGELMGFEYELVKRFAERHDLRVAMVVPPSHEELLDWVRQGRADLAAASLTITEEREQGGLRFSRPYRYVSEVLVTRDDESGVSALEDLAGRNIVARRNSSYWETLSDLQQAHGFRLETAPETLETEQIIANVASADYDLTVADSHIVDIEQTYRDDIRAAFTLSESRPHGWLMRADNPQLLEAVNAFHQEKYRGLFYNMTRTKYFGNTKRIHEHVTQRVDRGDAALSPYDELVRKHAARYGMDWRLILSQMYQESRFDAQAVSWMGAEGLMQVLPRTGKELGFDNLRDPEQGIHAGIKYMDWLTRRFEPELEMAERMWFTLAAYNAGIGHVRDARRLADKQGWDRNRWFGNVERAMLLLAEPTYHRQATHGYVRGQEPVNYVRHIRDRYEAYARLTGGRE